VVVLKKEGNLVFFVGKIPAKPEPSKYNKERGEKK